MIEARVRREAHVQIPPLTRGAEGEDKPVVEVEVNFEPVYQITDLRTETDR